MPPHLQNSRSEPGKRQIHSPFLHARLPQMLPLVNYAYKTRCPPPSSASETPTSPTPMSPPPVSSMTQTRKTSPPIYKQFHILVPPFAHHSEEHKQPSPSQTTPPPTKLSLPLLPECVTTLTMATHTSGKLKRLFTLLAPSDTEGCPAKMTRLQHLSCDSTKFSNWNLNLSRLPLRHQHPLTSPFQHLPFRETHKSQHVLQPPVPKSAQWPADRLRPSNRICYGTTCGLLLYGYDSH